MLDKLFLICKKCGSELVGEFEETITGYFGGSSLSVDVWVEPCKKCSPAPAPQPEAVPLVTFAGSVDYGDSPETPQLDENGDLRF